jgi:hypothetical protein
MTSADSAIVSLEREYDQFRNVGVLSPDELHRLGALASAVAAERLGPHRLVAYILRSVLFDFAQKAEGAPISRNTTDKFFATVDPPISAALASLKAPMSVDQSVALTNQLLDARSSLNQQC